MKNSVIALQSMLNKEVDNYMYWIAENGNQEQKSSAQERIRVLKEQVDSAYRLYNTELKRLEAEKLLTAEVEAQNKEMNGYLETVHELYQNTKQGQIESLTKQIADMEEKLAIGYVENIKDVQNMRVPGGVEKIRTKEYFTDKQVEEAKIVIEELKKD